MRRTTPIRWLTAAVLLPLVMLLGLASAQAFYRCAHDRRVRTVCCCPKAHEQAPAGLASMKAACCCKIEQAAHVDAPPAAQAHDRDASALPAHDPTLAAFALVPAPIVGPEVTRVPRERQPLAPPPGSASLFVQRIALLV